LPNPKDVADFLGVTEKGLFVFDQTYRPIPLTQTFIGVTEPNAMKRVNQFNEIAYDKCVGVLNKGKQAMVFVHSRKDTVKTARALAEMAGARGGVDLFGNVSGSSVDATKGYSTQVINESITEGTGLTDSTQTNALNTSGTNASHQTLVKKFQTEINQSKNPEVKELFAKGLGCHNAGMLRSDRGLVERAFAAGVIKVLVCTATLAWGVNLPAHLVVIKGTTLYDPTKGGFRDLGILDVQQIFGRAGRPGFDTSGQGVIICEHKKLAHYLVSISHPPHSASLIAHTRLTFIFTISGFVDAPNPDRVAVR
jgi:activating signal cointegrator complex subunit 3